MSLLTGAVWLGLAAGILAPAQSPQFGAPLSGLVYDPPSKSIRPLMGVPGAAWLGKPVLAGLDFASIAPDGRCALAIRGGQAALTVFDTAGVTETPIGGALPDADRAAWAPDASALVLSSSARRLLQRLTGLPDSPFASAPIQVAGETTALAIHGSSGAIAAGVRAGPDSGLYLLSETAPPVRVLSMDHPAAAVFSRDGQVLYVADRSTGEVFAVRNISAGSEILLLLAAEVAPAEPAGLAINGRLLFVAGAAARLVGVYDAPTGSRLREIPLDAVPAGAEPLSDRGLFLIAGPGASGQPLLVLDTRTQSVYYVPAGVEE